MDPTLADSEVRAGPEFLLSNLLDADIDFDIEWAFCADFMDQSDHHTSKDSQLNTETRKEVVGEKREQLMERETERDAKRIKGKASWRKYGQKTLKGKDYTGMQMLRCYFRCNHPGCPVRKQVETFAWSNETGSVTVQGVHNHSVEQLSKEQPKQRIKTDLPEKPTPPLNHAFADMVVRAQPHFVVSDPHQENCPIIFASSGFLKLTGYSMDEILGRNCKFMQGKDTNPLAVEELARAIKAQREIHMILLNYKKDGSPFWNLLHLSPVIGIDGRLHSIVGSQLDVSGFVEQTPTQHPSNVTSRK